MIRDCIPLFPTKNTSKIDGDKSAPHQAPEILELTLLLGSVGGARFLVKNAKLPQFPEIRVLQVFAVLIEPKP